MKNQIIVSIFFAATLLGSGCGVNKERFQKVADELVKCRQRLSECEKNATNEIQRLTDELKNDSREIARLNKEIKWLKTLEVSVFAEAGRLLDSGDYTESLRMYRTFVRDFPSSQRLPAAQLEMDKIERRLETQQKEKIERMEAEKKKKESLDIEKRIKSGVLAQAEIQKLLEDFTKKPDGYELWTQGKNSDQVLELFGKPNETLKEDSVWEYKRRSIHPLTQKIDDLYITFVGIVPRESTVEIKKVLFFTVGRNGKKIGYDAVLHGTGWPAIHIDALCDRLRIY